MFQLALNNIEETAIFAQRFVEWILPAVNSQGISVALEGELGSGKTTFVAAVARALKSRDSVSSPTYVLEQQYQCQEDISVHHWDLYRLPPGTVPDELFEAVEIKEIRFIEWASRSTQLYERSDLKMTFYVISDDLRRCEFSILNLQSENIIGRWVP